jgi:hypothetical protein
VDRESAFASSGLRQHAHGISQVASFRIADQANRPRADVLDAPTKSQIESP